MTRKQGRPAATTVDWAEVRQKLEKSSVNRQGSEAVSAEKMNAILRQRAEKLAEAPLNQDARDEREMLLFDMAGEKYALPTEWIFEVFFLERLTPVPGTPEFMAGVTNHRGMILAVIDLVRYFSLPSGPGAATSHVVLVGQGTARFGFLVDKTLEVLNIPRSSIHRQEKQVLGPRNRFIEGITQGAFLILDGRMLLNEGNFVITQTPDPIGEPRA